VYLNVKIRPLVPAVVMIFPKINRKQGEWTIKTKSGGGATTSGGGTAVPAHSS